MPRQRKAAGQADWQETASTTVVAPLLDWARENRRDLPWRRTRDAWSILVSEIMLQQTQVERVIERYHTFLGQFPTARDCANATAADVIALWAGLGYNRRAVNLWRAAVKIRDEHDGDLPEDLDGLLALPGVGPYTARAVLAFAFEHDVGVVDTNVGRLLARWSGQPHAPAGAQRLADALVPSGSGWEWNQGLFDFAVAVCAKRSPSCGSCPVRSGCVWHGCGVDPAAASAGVSTPQSRFEGSLRQVRGRIVDALRHGPVDIAELVQFGRQTDTHRDVVAIADALVADGLAHRHGDTLHLGVGPTT